MNNAPGARKPQESSIVQAMRPERSVRYVIILVDVIGLVGLVGTLETIFRAGFIPNEGAGEVIQSISADLIAVWLAVRLIDWIVRSRDRSESVRTRVLRNARYWRGALGRMLRHVDLLELDTLWHETEYTRQLVSESTGELAPNEKTGLRQMLDAVKESLAVCEVIGWSASRVETLVRQFEADNLVYIRQARSGERSVGPDEVMRAAELRQIVTMAAQRCNEAIHDFGECRTEIATARRAVDTLDGSGTMFDREKMAAFFAALDEAIDSKQRLAEKYVGFKRLVSELGADVRHDIPERYS